MPQDFSGQNARGRSFKGQNLEGANFSYADIRGADFSGANLRGANFSHAQAGLQWHWIVYLLTILFLLGLLITFTVSVVRTLELTQLELYAKYHFLTLSFYSLLNFLIILIFFIVIIRQGLTEAMVAVTLIAGSGAASSLLLAKNLQGASALAGYALWVIVVAVAGIMIFTATAAVIGSATWIMLVQAMIAWVINILMEWVVIYFWQVNEITARTLIFGLGLSSILWVLASLYVSHQTLNGNKNFAVLRMIAIAFAAIGGTTFCGADLTNANFTNAILKSTDFRKANLRCSRWSKAQMLDLARVGGTYLEKPKVRQLLVTGMKQEDNNFDHQNLRGINLQGANLVDASFIGADLSEANLQDADLSRAKLVQTQLDGTDFTGATLTGAFIQDWGITRETKFDGVRCEYIYMRLPTQEDPDPHRKPDNRQEMFANGEFGDFIKPIFDTLDLYHNQGVDPRAIAISFKQLAENHPEAELEIVAMEKRGQDKFLLRAKTAATVNKSELSAEYFDSYNQLKGLPEREIKLLLEEKDSRIRSLEIFVNQALQRPSYYSNVEQVGTMTNNPGGFSVGGSVGGDIRNLQGDNNRAVQGDNNQGVLGDNNQVTQQNQVGADTGESLTKEDVVKLLAQLETLIQGAELPADTKEEVIEDLSAAKKATDKEEPNKQRALERLTGVAETLDKTSKGVEAGQKIWTIAKPIIVKIATWLGAAAGSHLLGL